MGLGLHENMRLKLTGNNSNYSSNAHLDGGIKCVTINRDPLGIGNDTGPIQTRNALSIFSVSGIGIRR